MRPAKFFVLSALAIVVFDGAASLASKALEFPYSYAMVGSIALYLVLAFLCARKFGFLNSLGLGAFLGLTDATIGWAVSWAVGPGRLEGGEMTALVWALTAVVVVILATTCASVGGGIGAVVSRRSAAGP